MRVLVTGASGFIGSHLSRLLLDSGCEVTALIRPGSAARPISDILPRLSVIEGDLTRIDELEKPIQKAKPEVCFHLAWGLSDTDPLNSLENISSLSGSLALLTLLGRSGCRRIVTAQTSIEYADSSERVGEESPILPANLYAACKHALFLAAGQLSRKQGWSFAAARLFCLYGPWDSERKIVPSLIKDLLKGYPCDLTQGEQVKDYLYVKDVAGALWTLAQSSLAGAVNIGSSQPIAIKDLAKKIGVLLEKEDLLRFGTKPTRDGEPGFLCADTQLLRSRTHWTPKYSLEEGLRKTISWGRESLV